MSNTRTVTLAEAKTLLGEIPFFVEDFKPISIQEEFYTRTTSPLFSSDVIDTSPTPTAISAVIAAVPVYHSSGSVLQQTRDPGQLDVPSILQTEYWQTLFRDCFGAEHNTLLIAAHNRLRYPYLSEETILYTDVFKKMLTTDTDTERSDVLFESDVFGANEILDMKLAAEYATIDYVPLHSAFIDSWLESMYFSGQLTYEDRITEENLYRIQDVKAELLRRKFAGSASLYYVVLSAINRRGAYTPVVPLSSVVQQGQFADTRYIRALDLPGITTNASETTIDPMTAFEGEIPMRILASLYYSSASYSSEDFVSDRSQFLRNQSIDLVWDNIRGISDPSLIRKAYPRLDQTNPKTSKIYTMDITWVELEETKTAKLDDSQPIFDLSSTTAGFFDIQADQLVFHENSVQKARKYDYPYVTYSFAGDSGPCMIDLQWMDYIEKAITAKKRIQEELKIGVQISRYVSIPREYIEENFTVITFDEEISEGFEGQQSSYSAAMKYAFLWNIQTRYSREDFSVVETRESLLTYMLLQVDASTLDPLQVPVLSVHDSYAAFTEKTVGIIPFAYKNLQTTEILSMRMELSSAGIRDDVWEEEYNKAYFLFTPYENVAISRAYLKSSPGDLTAIKANGIADWFNKPESDEALKHVIFGITRINTRTGLEEYFWSDPMRLYPKAIKNIREYRPDWMEMVFYMNPYLNFTEQCSSPARRKELPLRALRPATQTQTPEGLPTDTPVGPNDKYAALCNLNLVHGMQIFTNETGSQLNPNYPKGTYLTKVRPAAVELVTESMQIWGDNRPTWNDAYAQDPRDEWDLFIVRTTEYKDSRSIPCLKMATGQAYSPSVAVDSYYTLSPDKVGLLDAAHADWVWNRVRVDGMTFFIDLAIETDATRKQYLANRVAAPNASDVHAEFEAYYNGPTEELVFKVYPTGRVADNVVFETKLLASHILGKQSQLGFSYKYEIDPANPLKLNICVSIIADRVWVAKYYSTVSSLDALSYDIYETAEDWDIEALAPTSLVLPVISGYDYGAGYDVDDRFMLGKLVKYQGQTACKLHEIDLFSRNRGHDVFAGLVYDVRLLNRGLWLEEAIISAGGTRRELYSYSPSLYKLLYQHFSDLGVMKRANGTTGEADEVPGRVRIFSRGVWDSIITDLYPISAEEKTVGLERYRADFKEPLDDADVYDILSLENDYAPGVVDQTLVTDYESMAEVLIGTGAKLFYKGVPQSVVPTSKHSLVQTTIYPQQYTDSPFTSSLVLKKDEAASTATTINLKAYHDGISYLPTGAHACELPVVPSGNTLEYKATIDLDFTINSDIDASAPLARGSNLKIAYDEEIQDFVVAHSNVSAAKSAQANHLLLPLYISNQGDNELFPNWEGKLLGFNFEKLKLNSAISKMLDARSYYTEVQIPYAYEDDTVSTGLSYTSRWDAVRTLKDGEYFITCKYPVRFLPMENLPSKAIDSPAILYAALRFKIVVQSAAKAYTESKFGYRAAWEPSNFQQTVETLYAPADNRTFPHREVKIDLYAMQHNSVAVVPTTWRWEKLASNWEVAAGVQLLSTVQNELVIQEPLSAYFTSSYTTPFFLKDGTSVVTDSVQVRIDNAVSGTENLTARTSADLSTISLKTSRAYRILMEYSANVTEFSYSANNHPVLSEIAAEEYADYKELTSLLQNSDRGMYMYSGDINWCLQANDYDVDSTKTGYALDGSGAWIAPNTDYPTNNLSLGDPFSNAASKNRLIDELPARRFDIVESFYFSYRQENKELVSVLPPRLFGSPSVGEPLSAAPRLPLIARNPAGGYNRSFVMFDEFTTLQKQSNSIRSALADSWMQLRRSASGVIARFGKMQPIVSEVTSSEMCALDTHTLIAYISDAFASPLATQVTVTREGLYESNLISSQDFSDAQFYSNVLTPQFEWDATKNKDVFSFSAGVGTESILTYQKDIGASAVYEVALSVFSSVATKVAVKFVPYNSAVSGAYAHLTPETGAWTSSFYSVPANTWTVVHWESPKIDPAKLVLFFKKENDAVFANERIRINRLVARHANTYSHQLGFSDVVLGTQGSTASGQSMLSIAGQAVVAFQRNDFGTVFPLQFKNKRIGAAFNLSESFAKEFIDRYKLLAKNASYSEIVPMLRPWTRMMIYKETDNRKLKMFALTKTEKNGIVSSSFTKVNNNGIFTVNNDFADDEARTIRYVASYNDMEYRGGLVLDLEESQRLCDSNLAPVHAAIVTEERFSLVGGCINPEKFIAKQTSLVSITNIQILNNDDEDPAIVYEMEYFPIIYDESRHHLSLNFLVRNT